MCGVFGVVLPPGGDQGAAGDRRRSGCSRSSIAARNRPAWPSATASS